KRLPRRRTPAAYCRATPRSPAAAPSRMPLRQTPGHLAYGDSLMKKLALGLFLTTAMQWGMAQNLPDFADLAEKQGEAVVNVSTTQVVRSNAGAFPFDPDDPAFEMFKRF